MLELAFKGDLKEIVKKRNVAELLNDEDLKKIGLRCKQEFDADKTSRVEWEEWYADAMKLALQVMEEKSYPWPNCSNVKIPLITIAALNFHAKAYPNLISGKQVVAYKPIGDPTGPVVARAQQVQDHQNYLLLEATDWEEQTDRALISLPIMGSCFKKTFFDHDTRFTASKLVLAMNLVVPYFTVSLETSPRISEIIALSANSFKTKVRRKQYLGWEYLPSYGQTEDAMTAAKSASQHTPPSNSYEDGAPTQLIEQHRYLDLDGDGYEEPYVVTFVRETGQVCRIVARFTMPDVEFVEGTKTNQVAYIAPQHFYTKYSFLPSPDGGFYDMGFGMLLGPLNYAADSLINQLIDAGTMHNLGGGFMGRGVKIRKGENTFEPMEWKSVDSTGPSLKDNIVPLPTRTPSQVLLDLLVFLMQYAERISSANEVQMGELPKDGTKTGAMEIANANGQRIFAAIYKRVWRCFKEEFIKFYDVTATASKTTKWGGRNLQTDKWFNLDDDAYSGLSSAGIWPAANPDVSSREQEIIQAREVMQSALNIPGQDVYVATMRYYKALRVPNPEEIYPNPKDPKVAIPAQPNTKLIDSQAKMLMAQARAQEVEYQKATAFASVMAEVQESQAKIIELMASAQKLKAEAAGVQTGHAIALIDAEIALRKQTNDGMLSALKLLTTGAKNAQRAEGGSAANTTGSNVSSMVES